MKAKLLAFLPFVLAACAATPPISTEPANAHGYVWLATPRPKGEDAARSTRFQEHVAAALARQGYRQDSTGALGIALSFTGARDPSIGPYQGGYAFFAPSTQCDVRHQPGQPMMGCVSIFHLRSGRPVGPASGPIAWDADGGNIDRALVAALRAGN
jgi:hypothetical protein